MGLGAAPLWFADCNIVWRESGKSIKQMTKSAILLDSSADARSVPANDSGLLLPTGHFLPGGEAHS